MTSAGRESEVPPHSFAGVGGVGRAKMGCQRTCLTREPNGHKMWAMKDKHTKLGVSTDRQGVMPPALLVPSYRGAERGRNQNVPDSLLPSHGTAGASEALDSTVNQREPTQGELSWLSL